MNVISMFRRTGADNAETERFPAMVPGPGEKAAPAAFAGSSQPGQMERHHAGPLEALPPRTWDERPSQPAGDPWRYFNAHSPLRIPNPSMDEIAPAWPHLFVIRCAYPAAPAATPIPCSSAHRDPDAGSFRGLRRSAFAAGWHLDAFGRMACPSCVRESPEYRTLYPVTFWAAGAAWLGQDEAAAGMWRTAPPRVEDYPVRPEFPLIVIAEAEVRERVALAAVRGRHAKAGAA